jgi:hypothetical protein
MDYLWKENKKFATAVAGGLVFLLLYGSFVTTPLRKGASSAQAKRRQEKQSLDEKLKSGLPGEDVLALARRDVDLARKQAAEMAAATNFKVADRFRRKGGKDGLKAFYDGLKEDLKDELQRKAVQGNLVVPRGLGLQDDGLEEEAESLLLRLAMVERLVLAAIESGIEKIDQIDTRPQETEDYSRVAPRGAAAGGIVKATTVRMKFSGRPESIFRMVHAAQAKGSYLAVTRFEASRPDPTRDGFEASMTAAMLQVDEKAPASAGGAR